MADPLPSCQARAGNALVAVAVAVVVLLTMVTTLGDLTLAGYRQQLSQRQQLDRLFAAESAANLAYAHLQADYRELIADELDPIDDSEDPDAGYAVPLADQYGIDIDVVDGLGLVARIYHTAGTTDDDRVFLIRGTATAGEAEDPMGYARHRVEFVVRTETVTVFSQAMFAIEGYDFMGSAETDSWDSRDGPYDPDLPGWEGDLGSEGAIYVPDNKLDDPDDPTDDPDVKGQVNDQQEAPLPEFSFADMLAQYPPRTDLSGTEIDTAWVRNADADADNGTNTWLLAAAGSPYEVRAVDLGNKDVISISGVVRLFVHEHIDLSQTAFVYAAGAQLIIYQDDYDTGAGTGMQLNGNDAVGHIIDPGDGTLQAMPADLQFYTAYDGLMTMNGNGMFSGVLYAPDATIKLNGTFDFYGSVIARAFASQVGGAGEQGRVNGTYHFHYDESLGDLDPDLTPRLVLSGWRAFGLGYHQE